jgi:hypothetical protein
MAAQQEIGCRQAALMRSLRMGTSWSLGFEPAAAVLRGVKRQIRTANGEEEELHGWSLFGFTECLTQDVPPCFVIGSGGFLQTDPSALGFVSLPYLERCSITSRSCRAFA